MKLRGNNLVSTQNFNSAYASFLLSHVSFVTFHTFIFPLGTLPLFTTNLTWIKSSLNLIPNVKQQSWSQIWTPLDICSCLQHLVIVLSPSHLSLFKLSLYTCSFSPWHLQFKCTFSLTFVTFHTFTFHLELLLFYLNFYICHFSHFYSNVTAIVLCPSPFVTFSTSINLASIQFVVDPIRATKLNSNVNSSLPSAQPKVNWSCLTSSSRWIHSFHFVLHFH